MAACLRQIDMSHAKEGVLLRTQFDNLMIWRVNNASTSFFSFFTHIYHIFCLKLLNFYFLHEVLLFMKPQYCHWVRVRGLKIHSIYPHHSIHSNFEHRVLIKTTIPKPLLWVVNVNDIWHLISSAFCYWKLYELMRKEDIWEHNSYLILIGKHPAHTIY